MDPSTNDAPHSLGERFRVESKLGRGGSGDVYKAFDTVLQRTVAVKVLQPERADEQAGKRLLREARACARLAHPNIVTIHDVLQVDSGVGIVMEHLEGRSLEEADTGPNSRTLEGRTGILVRILDGLHYAHGRGVVHRDIKPRNVQLLPDGSIKVLDFGVAHIVGAETLTVTGTLTGTVHYASPEQLRGEDTDARTDIYSTGILAYELLTGRRPFNGDSMGAVLTKVLHEPLPDMDGDWNEGFPEVEKIIQTATAKDRNDRYASAEEMRKALDSVLTSMRGKDGQTGLGTALPQAAPAGSIHTEETHALEAADARPASTAGGAAIPREAEPSQAAEDTRRWPRTVLAAGVAVAVVGGILWTNQWRATGAPEPIPAAVEPRTEEGLDVDRPRRVDAVAAALPLEVAAAPGPSDSARVLYYAAVAGSEEARAARTGDKAGIRYRVLQRGPTGEAVEVDPDATFRSGDRIRFSFEPNVDGFLYVVQRGSTGLWSVLLPHPLINDGGNAVKEFEEVAIPPEGWFRFDDNPGTEQVFVYLSREPIKSLPGGTGRVDRPHSADDHTVSILAGSVRSRDLVFEKEDTPEGTEQASYVVNHGNAEGAVAWTVELEHR